MSFYNTLVAYDDCASTPCGNRENICINKQDGYQCHCFGGYKGLNCEIPPDFCSSTSCGNGATCVSHFANFTCMCTEGFTGDLCETEIGKYQIKAICLRSHKKISTEIIRGMTHNILAKLNRANNTKMTHKILRRKLNIEQNESV